jgi:hypothetical protein
MDCFRLRPLSYADKWRSLSSGAHPRDPLARKDELPFSNAANLPDGQIKKTCPALRAKIFRFRRRANQGY